MCVCEWGGRSHQVRSGLVGTKGAGAVMSSCGSPAARLKPDSCTQDTTKTVKHTGSGWGRCIWSLYKLGTASIGKVSWYGVLFPQPPASPVNPSLRTHPWRSGRYLCLVRWGNVRSLSRVGVVWGMWVKCCIVKTWDVGARLTQGNVVVRVCAWRTRNVHPVSLWS